MCVREREKNREEEGGGERTVMEVVNEKRSGR